jgi:Acetyltransferases, including N-acetylases of ribosomal proteins
LSDPFSSGFNPQPVLRGPNLLLRPMTEADRSPLFAVASDPLIWAQHPAHDRWQERVFNAFFDEGLTQGGALVALDLNDGSVIGSSRFAAARAEPGEVEIGWTFLARNRWGGRWNREMKRLMLRHVFASDLQAAIFLVGETNIRSQRALDALGARLTERQILGNSGERPVLHRLYRLSRPEAAAFIAGPDATF